MSVDIEDCDSIQGFPLFIGIRGSYRGAVDNDEKFLSSV